MLITVASIVGLAAFAVRVWQWRLRGGRWSYQPASGLGQIAQVVCLTGLLALSVLVLAGRVGSDVYSATIAALMLLDVSHTSSRREHEYQLKSSAA